MSNIKITKETINRFSYVSWHINKGNFNGRCCDCGSLIKKGDNILLESDTGNGLNINKFCGNGCGKARLLEYSEYYKGLTNE